MSKLTVVATYGTLMTGQHNHYLLKGQTSLGPARADFYSTMLTAGGFPQLIVEDPDSKCHVELFAVTDEALEGLDALEGHPHWYERKERHFITPQGERVMAWIYIMPDPDGALLGKLDVVPDGDWLKYKGVK